MWVFRQQVPARICNRHTSVTSSACRPARTACTGSGEGSQLAQTGPPTMSAVRSLTGEDRSWRGWPNLVANAEWARGISPRAPHRTGRDTLASSGSCPPHEGCRLPLNIGFFPLPVDPSQMAMARSLRSTGITPASSLLRSSPPLPGASVLSASRLTPLAPFPWHRRAGSHVPYKSLIELRAAYMPDVARAVSGIPRADPGGRVTPGSDIA
jgi:hypothetical protein